VPRYFEEQIANLRAGLARGYTVPRVSTVGRDKTIEPYVRPDTTNPHYAAFTRMPASIPAADQAAMRAEAGTVIRDVVAPAYDRLLTMMRAEYLPKTRTTLAAADLPEGNAFYQAMIEKFTTLKLTARQIHDIGLAEVARIEAEMAATKERAGFKGSMTEFFRFLRTDPQFYAQPAGRDPDPPAPPRGRREAGHQVRPAHVPRRDSGARCGAASGAGAADGAVHRGRGDQPAPVANGRPCAPPAPAAAPAPARCG